MFNKFYIIITKTKVYKSIIILNCFSTMLQKENSIWWENSFLKGLFIWRKYFQIQNSLQYWSRVFLLTFQCWTQASVFCSIVWSVYSSRLHNTSSKLFWAIRIGWHLASTTDLHVFKCHFLTVWCNPDLHLCV